MHVIKAEGKNDQWFLVKVPKITNQFTGKNATAAHLRDAVRDHLFGGETATVRGLTPREVEAIKQAKP